MKNREIKFRVWDTEMHMWIYNIGMGRNNTLCKGTEKRFHVMQFAGLKDKNGKEIYEGDIIRGETRNFEVIFYDGMFTTDVGRYLLNREYEKIGNIYENPELLERSEK